MNQDTKKKEIIKLIASSSQAFTKESIANIVKTTPDYVYEVALEAGLHGRLKGAANLGPTGRIQYPDSFSEEALLAERVETTLETSVEQLKDLVEGSVDNRKAYIAKLAAKLADAQQFLKNDKWVSIAKESELDEDLEELERVSVIAEVLYKDLTSPEDEE